MSQEEIYSLETLYLDWPKSGVMGVSKYVLPHDYRLAVLAHADSSDDLTRLMQSWEDGGLEACPPFRPLETTFDQRLVGAVRFAKPISLLLHDRPEGPVDLAVVRRAVKGMVVSCLIIFLTLILPERTRSSPIPDLYLALRDPEAQSNLSFVGKWILGCFRELMVLKNFASVEDFVTQLHQMDEESRGYGHLIEGINFNLDMTKEILPAEKTLHLFTEIPMMFDRDMNSPVFFYFIHMIEWSDVPGSQVWTVQDRIRASEILSEYDKKGHLQSHD